MAIDTAASAANRELVRGVLERVDSFAQYLAGKAVSFAEIAGQEEHDLLTGDKATATLSRLLEKLLKRKEWRQRTLLEISSISFMLAIGLEPELEPATTKTEGKNT